MEEDTFDVLGPGTVIQWKGTQDFELLYKKIWEWFGINDYSMEELHYEEKRLSFGTNMVIKWEGKKPGKKCTFKNDYFAYKVKVDFLVIGLKEAETAYEGNKIKVNNADTKIKFKATVIKNSNKKFKEKTLQKQIYERYIIPTTFEEAKIELYSEIHEVIGLTKSFLNLYHF
ncbi:hypothetical protein J4436_02420 [Candidatus Woesearchaeota archaeon]|nr:hypothetical protein [Candidatus Woesearchaeota archaeon]